MEGILSDFCLDDDDDDGGEEEFIPACAGCIHYTTEEDQDGWENPKYTVPICLREEGLEEGPRIYEDGSIEDWPVDCCPFRKSANDTQKE